MRNDKVALWEERLNEMQTFGLTVDEFCEKYHAKKHSYYYWKRKLTVSQPPSSDEPAFVEIRNQDDILELTSGSSLRITWKDDFQFFLSSTQDAILAAEFLRQVEKRC